MYIIYKKSNINKLHYLQNKNDVLLALSYTESVVFFDHEISN